MKSITIHKVPDKSRGAREPILDEASGQVVGLKPWPLKGVEIVGDAPLDHVFSRQYVEQAMAEGWMERQNGSLVIRAMNRTLRYEIVEPPGRYTDPMEPSGIRVSHAYTVQLRSF